MREIIIAILALVSLFIFAIVCYIGIAKMVIAILRELDIVDWSDKTYFVALGIFLLSALFGRSIKK